MPKSPALIFRPFNSPRMPLPTIYVLGSFNGYQESHPPPVRQSSGSPA